MPQPRHLQPFHRYLQQPPKDNNTTCTDGNACTSGDKCMAGVCTSGTPKVCTPLNNCHQATCNPLNGWCIQAPLGDGVACQDGNLCTENDTCQSGACASGQSKQCPPSNDCHLGGCEVATGQCLSITLENGHQCNDGNPCTLTDACLTGSCVGSDPRDCSSSDPCQVGMCNTANGSCGSTPASSGTPCTASNSGGRRAVVLGQLNERVRSRLQLAAGAFAMLFPEALLIGFLGGAAALATGAPATRALLGIAASTGTVSLLIGLFLLVNTVVQNHTLRDERYLRLAVNHAGSPKRQFQRVTWARHATSFRPAWVFPGRVRGQHGALGLSGNDLLFIPVAGDDMRRWPADTIMDCSIGHSGLAAIFLVLRLADGTEVVFETLEPQGWADIILAKSAGVARSA